MKTILFFILGICLVSKSYGTHLIGSQITYQYIRTLQDSSREYKFTINISRDCANGAAELPDELNAGVYNTQTKRLLRILNFKLSDKQINDCYTMCVEEGNYYCTTVLPYDTAYYVTLAYCCRRTVQNIRNGQNGDPDVGFMIYCLVPSMVNSSALFSADKILSSQPSVTDTFRFYTQDRDGDSVAVILTPSNVGASLTNNFPSPSETFSGFTPISPSQYTAGYNAANPLGLASTMICDPTNKFIVVKCGFESVYSVAYKVSEFRKGVLIAEYVRESLVYITNSPKPIQKIILSGIGFLSPDHAQLNWTAPCPSHIKKQYLERSTDDQLHYIIFDSTASTYGFSDDITLVRGHTYYYRVRTVGTDGSQYYSNVWGLNNFGAGIEEINASHLDISPVPVQDVCNLSVTASHIASCVIMDMTGRVVTSIEIPEPGAIYSLNCSNLSSGVYMIKVYTLEGNSLSRKIVKE